MSSDQIKAEQVARVLRLTPLEFDPINNQTKLAADVFRNKVKLNDDEWQDNRFPQKRLQQG